MKNSRALYLVNGSLGAGKTTLLQYLLQQEQYSGARVIENEFAAKALIRRLLQGMLTRWQQLQVHVFAVAAAMNLFLCCAHSPLQLRR